MFHTLSIVGQVIEQLIQRPGGVLPYQSGGGVPPEPHGAHGEREKSRNVWSPRENY